MKKVKTNWEERKQLAKRVIEFYKNQANRDSKKTWQFFKQENIRSSNAYSYIKKFKESENVGFDKPSGRPAKLGTTKVKNRIKKIFENHSSTSTTAAAE